MREGKVKELNLLVKSDVQGSAEALKHSLSQIGDENLKVRLIHDARGQCQRIGCEPGVGVEGDHHCVQRQGGCRRATPRPDRGRRHPQLCGHLQAGRRHRGGAARACWSRSTRSRWTATPRSLQIFKAGRTLIIGGCRVTDGKLVRSAQTRAAAQGRGGLHRPDPVAAARQR